MAHVLFGDTDDWELLDDDQDLRGWEVRDSNGATVGRVGDMAVDTDRKVVDTIILEDGTRFRAEDVTLSDGVVYVTTYGAPSGVATRAYTDAHGVRRVGAAPVVPPPVEAPPPEVVHEQAEMRREMREPDRVEEVREGRREVAEAHRDAAGYAAHEDDFRKHYRDTFGDLDFADYSPAYRYGYDVAYDDRYTGRDFGDVEPDLREAYYRRFGYPMSDNIVWSRVKGAVRHAYERARAATH